MELFKRQSEELDRLIDAKKQDKLAKKISDGIVKDLAPILNDVGKLIKQGSRENQIISEQLLDKLGEIKKVFTDNDITIEL